MRANKPFETDLRKRLRPLARPLNGGVSRQEENPMEDQVFIANGIAYRKVPPGVYEIPLSALGDLSMGHLLPHSSVHIADLPPPPPDHEFYLSITNGGDTNDNQYLNIFACVSFGSDEQRQAKMSRIRRAYLPLVERGELPEAFITPSTKDRPNKAAAFSIDLADRPTAIIREEIQPILQLFRRLSVPDRRVFICHATEDKPSAHRIAAYMRQAGAEVWLDEWEIKVGDSIVEKVNAGLSGATHMLLLLSATSVQKPWVRREFSSTLMRQLSSNSVRVLPVLLESCEVPSILSDIRYADFRNHNETAYEQISHAIFQPEANDADG